MKLKNKIILVLAMGLMLGMQKTPVMAAGSGSLLDPWQIFTVEDLKAIGTVGDWDDAYILMNDLDLSSENWVPLGSSGAHLFTGTFDGNEHEIQGLTIDLSDNTSPLVSIGLFYGLGGATITDLNLSQVDIQVTVADPDLYAGVLAGFAKVEDGGQLSIDHVVISGSMKVTYRIESLEFDHRYVGGMIGEVIGDDDPTKPSLISNNIVKIDQEVFLDQAVEGWFTYYEDLAIGGFVGHATDVLFQSNILESSVVDFTTDVNFYWWDAIYVGGVVGLYTPTTDFTETDRALFLDTTARSSSIKGFNHVGGLIGAYTGSIDNTIYEAALSDVSVQGSYKVGGIIGKGNHLSFENIRIKNETMTALTADTNSYFGGVAGDGSNLTFKGVVTIDGFTFRKANSESNAGSVGSMAGILTDSTSTALITANNIDIVANNVVGGLFGSTWTVTVKQATVTEAIITGDSNIGGITGVVEYGTLSSFSNITVDGTIRGTSFVGGVAGRLEAKTVIDHAIILGDIHINGYWGGGMIGRSILSYNDNDQLVITESYVRAHLLHTYDSQAIGGLIGGGSSSDLQASKPILLTDVYFAGQILLVEDLDHPDITNPEKIDPIMGWDLLPGVHVFTHVYYDATLYEGTNHSGIGTAKTTSELMGKQGYDGFDFTGLDHWFIYDKLNDGYATFNPGLIRIDFLDTDGTVLGILVVDPNTVLEAPQEPVLNGHVFLNWTDESDQVFDFTQAVTESIVLKANYKEGLPDTGETGSWLWILSLALGLIWISRKKHPAI